MNAKRLDQQVSGHWHAKHQSYNWKRADLKSLIPLSLIAIFTLSFSYNSFNCVVLSTCGTAKGENKLNISMSLFLLYLQSCKEHRQYDSFSISGEETDAEYEGELEIKKKTFQYFD
jgi:hypothetical protein